MCFGIAPFILRGTAHPQQLDPPQPPYTLRVHAIKVADNDGRRAAGITPQEVKAWVDKANSIYATAGIQFRFDPNPNGADWSTLNNTAINNLSSSNSATWSAANALAAQYPSCIRGNLASTYSEYRFSENVNQRLEKRGVPPHSPSPFQFTQRFMQEETSGFIVDG